MTAWREGFVIEQSSDERRQVFALVMLHALVANPERYNYIKALLKGGATRPALSQEQATAKNVDKAVMLADALIAALDKPRAP